MDQLREGDYITQTKLKSHTRMNINNELREINSLKHMRSPKVTKKLNTKVWKDVKRFK